MSKIVRLPNYMMVPTNMYNTGYIPSSNARLRVRQGLAPQDITNACTYIPKEKIMGVGSKYSDSDPILCDQKALYPAKQRHIDYGIPPIPDNCSCLQYIKAP